MVSRYISADSCRGIATPPLLIIFYHIKDFIAIAKIMPKNMAKI
jgi:hypothetical protein